MQNVDFEIVKKNNPLGINDCIIQRAKVIGRESDTTLHWHHGFELTLVIEGCICYLVEGKQHLSSSGDFLFINSGVIHQTQNIDNFSTIRALILVIPDSILKELVPEISYPYFSIKENSQERKEITKCLYQISDILENPQPFQNLLIRKELLSILYLLYSKFYHTEHVQNFSKSVSKKVIKHVGQHYSEELSIKNIAAIAGLQANYFCRYFKKETGISFHQYLSRIRLDAALALLTTGRYTVLDCALETGFSSEKVMIDWCRKVYNCTPLQYKSNSV